MLLGLEGNTYIEDETLKRITIDLTITNNTEKPSVIGQIHMLIIDPEFSGDLFDAADMDGDFLYALQTYADAEWEQNETIAYIEDITMEPTFRDPKFFADINEALRLWLKFERVDVALTIPIPRFKETDEKEQVGSREWQRSLYENIGFAKCTLVPNNSATPVWMFVNDRK